jgi:signal transduction histidine kinase
MSLELLTELLEGEQLDRERALRISQLSTRNVKNLFQVVDGILDLSRIEAGVWIYEETEIQPAVLVHEAIVYMEPLAVAKGLGLVAQLPEALPLIRGDWEKLFRVLVNLMDNAIKFSEAGQVLVSAAAGDGEIEIAVSDPGMGIRPENLDRVFDRFFQEKTRISGTGVGLTICQAIVKDHGGRIWAESAGRGQGATFRLVLPVESS